MMLEVGAFGQLEHEVRGAHHRLTDTWMDDAGAIQQRSWNIAEPLVVTSTAIVIYGWNGSSAEWFGSEAARRSAAGRPVTEEFDSSEAAEQPAEGAAFQSSTGESREDDKPRCPECRKPLKSATARWLCTHACCSLRRPAVWMADCNCHRGIGWCAAAAAKLPQAGRGEC